ncbi:hypothetical protein COV24_05160 [candidate division WWE3 bacterium CG10_big_fil_rev_8_21_14_0_10_32_10]|uniref:Sulfotransferase domain-containing protein n=1 Tax=candidate division WWE3 bacterium CG10_big_fil_rev_8_21_14_0_10_32_10 TaxID=1975090 RepID=A0A2H0R900_UNCKA|nr:MAG: hypothetical protein COV24_05160 [candidate division WWE3 bacterium CG10_big_fil_rev_8_21_14_0_10_32_10]
MKDFKLDFIGIGAPRSGTTWVYNCLKEHPQIQMSFEKEISFFNDTGGMFHNYIDSNYKKGLNWYIKQFPIYNKNKKFGSFTVFYLYDKKAAQRIKKHFPNTKIIVVLRNPVDRTYSHYWWYKKGYFEIEKSGSFEEAIVNNPEYVERSKYYKYLKRYYKIFGKDKIHVIIFYDIVNRPRKVIRDLYKFLNVDHTYTPLTLRTKVNTAKKTKYKLITHTINTIKYLRVIHLGFLIDIFKPTIIYKKVNELLVNRGTEEYKYERMKNSTRKMLKKEFLPDIEKLEKLIGRDLGIWE